MATGVKLVGRSAQHLRLLETLAKVAASDAEVLISGPSGVGKELYARYAHDNSRRRRAPFVAVNSGALPDGLLENEMFGHAAGAFTGANAHAEGLVVAAEGGTLFLDEIDALSPAGQVKMLRFVQEKEYRRLGEGRVRRANVRVIAATNADLVAAVEEKRFRQDLFFRLRVAPVEVAPLCERADDVEPLLGEYALRCAAEYEMPQICFSESALVELRAYAWPGNVRELENCVRFLTCLQLGRPVEAHDLPLLRAADEAVSGATFREAKRAVVDRFERRYLDEALRNSGGNIAQAAQASGKVRRAFFELMRRHGVRATDYKADSSDEE